MRRCLRPAALVSVAALLLSVGSASAQSAELTVAAQFIAFAPQEVTVAPGTTVTWINTDPYQHTVTADDGSFDSGLVDQGQSYSVTFDTPGTYPYYCVPHGGPGGTGMAGLIIVQDVDQTE